jgi:hypothetical protein
MNHLDRQLLAGTHASTHTIAVIAVIGAFADPDAAVLAGRIG